MSQTVFYGPKDVRAIEVRLYCESVSLAALKAPYSSKIDILLSKNGLIN